ncbi:MAG: hypothetical protein HQL23_06640, partial [Candidatus Omnitrophica bacterium]|nr:hypothetical protein [Candidatus Omnitrophota bacterium]
MDPSLEIEPKNKIDVSKLQENLERTQRELAILYEISNAMRSTLELNTILYTILTGVTSHTGLGFNRAILFLVNPVERCLEPRMAIGPDSGEHAQKIWEYVTTSTKHIEDLIEEDKITKNATESSLFRAVKNIKIPLKAESNNVLAAAFREGNPIHLTQDKLSQYEQDALLQ